MAGYMMEDRWLRLFGGAEYSDRDLEPSLTVSQRDDNLQGQA